MRLGKYKLGKILLAGLMAAMVACSEEEAIVPSPVGPEEPIEEETILEAVTIQFGPEGTVETRAFNGDENAREHEFMNSLVAFIVDAEGKIEVFINATDSASFIEALNRDGAGNVAQYSTTVDLKPGTKTIYAFANMDRVRPVGDDQTSFLTTLKAIAEDTEWNKANVDGVVLSDPASTVNFKEGENQGFIPMSVVRRGVNLTVSGQQVNIELVRLVSRVDITLQNQQGAEVTVSDLTMSDFADRVTLFEPEENNPAAPTNATNSTKTFNDLDIKVLSQADPTEIVSFYVNETWGRTDPFSVALTIDEKKMTGETKGQTIRRNHILPLALRLAESALYLEVTAQVAPIGGYPVSVALDGKDKLTDNYAITLPEGCTFSVKGYLVGVAGDTEENRIRITDWTWDHEASSVCSLVGEIEETLELEDGTKKTVMRVTDKSGSISGHLTALPGQEVAFDFAINAPVVRTNCHLQVTTAEVGDAPWTSWNASLRQWQAKPTLYELVPLRMANPE